jgi:hypothetical protein
MELQNYVLILSEFIICSLQLMLKSRYLIWLLLVSGTGIKAQYDSTFVLAAYQNALTQYNNFFINQSGLFNGSKYKEPRQTNDDHPFYLTDDWQKANIQYDGFVFYDVDVLYDLLTDKLVIEHYNGEMVELVRQKLKEFAIEGRKFIQPGTAPAGNTLPEAGFYQVLYDGETKCLARWKKIYQQRVETGAVQVYYDEKILYYVLKNNRYWQVKSKKTLLSLLPEQKQNLKQHIKNNNLDFRRSPQEAFKEILTYHDRING